MPGRAADSCRHCFSWGCGGNRHAEQCWACYAASRANPAGTCSSCGRLVPLRHGHCRLCWLQARLLKAAPDADPRPYLAAIATTGHQLFLDLPNRRTGTSRRRPRRHRPSAGYGSVAEPAALVEWEQPGLFEARRDYLRFDPERHTDLGSPFVIAGRAVLATMVEMRGWSPEIRRRTDRGLVIVLSMHQAREMIHYSEITPLSPHRKVSVSRLAEVLTTLGLLVDDRPDTFELWLQRRLSLLAPGIATEVTAWLLDLYHGDARRRPRSRSLAWSYLSVAYPHLQTWSDRHAHLREVTRSDVTAALNVLRGSRRKNVHSALRSLFRYCLRRRLIFQDPTRGLVIGQIPRRQQLALSQDAYDQAVDAAVTADQRLMLALTVVHAAGRQALRHLTLDDIDLAAARIRIDGQARPLDDLTRQMLLEYLATRSRQWPHTANRHLFLTNQTAYDARPVSVRWCQDQFLGLTASLQQLRIDRYLDAALACHADPRHLAALLGVSNITALRYANAARALLDGKLETPPDPREPTC